jgi:hypothetical protein
MIFSAKLATILLSTPIILVGQTTGSNSEMDEDQITKNRDIKLSILIQSQP